jgi:hypothetical protein
MWNKYWNLAVLADYTEVRERNNMNGLDSRQPSGPSPYIYFAPPTTITIILAREKNKESGVTQVATSSSC